VFIGNSQFLVGQVVGIDAPLQPKAVEKELVPYHVEQRNKASKSVFVLF